MRSKVLGLVPGLLLGCVLLGAFGLRLWGDDFGLPAYTRYHPDEHALVDRAAQILWTGEWNLGRFNYPPFYAYLQAGAYAAFFLLRASRGDWSEVPPFPLTEYYHIGRELTGLVGTLTVLVVYLIGRQLGGRRTGLLAAALLGGCYLHVVHSHYATFDIMVAFLVALTLLFSTLILERREAQWYLLAGLCAGLAGATKYNGALVVVLPLLAHVLVTQWGEWGWINGRLMLVAGGFLAGFFGGNPFALGNLPEFLNGLALVLHHYGTAQPGFEGQGNGRWYLRAFLTSADAIFVLWGGLGLLALLKRDWKKGLLIVVFPVLYFWMVSRFVVRFERNMVPILPFLALGGGWALDQIATWLSRKLGKRVVWSHGLASLGVALILVLPLTAGIAFDWTISGIDHRETSGKWVEKHVPEGAKIAIEHYSIPFDYSKYSVEDLVRIDKQNLDGYRQEGFDLLIVSDGVWEVLKKQQEYYADRIAKLEAIETGATLLAEFTAEPPPIVVAGYPTISVYHFAPVRIYQVPE